MLAINLTLRTTLNYSVGREPLYVSDCKLQKKRKLCVLLRVRVYFAQFSRPLTETGFAQSEAASKKYTGILGIFRHLKYKKNIFL